MWPPLVLEVHTSGRVFTTPEGELTTENHLQIVQENEGVNYRNKFQKTPATHSTREGHGGLARNVIWRRNSENPAHFPFEPETSGPNTL